MAEERAVDASNARREIVVGAAVSIAGSPGCDWVVVSADDPVLMQRSLGDPVDDMCCLGVPSYASALLSGLSCQGSITCG